ncbi:MAG: hypothetical protein V4712_03535, partial [Pseudomonadota bacterium]
DAPKPPTYPFIILAMSKSADTKQPEDPNFGPICLRVSRFRYGRFSTASRFFRPASLRRVVFGEALSRESRRNPQEEKSRWLTFFCHAQCLQGFFTGAA